MVCTFFGHRFVKDEIESAFSLPKKFFGEEESARGGEPLFSKRVLPLSRPILSLPYNLPAMRVRRLERMRFSRREM